QLMPDSAIRLVPAFVLGLGCVLLLKIGGQSVTPLVAPLSTVPTQLVGYQGTDQVVDKEEQRVAGMDSYIMRVYRRDSTASFSLYVGYYEAQTQGKTIHSPKNCLPGAGWEALEAAPIAVTTANGTAMLKRYR